MSLPSLTKNEKLILASLVTVLVLLWIVGGGYVWIKSKEYATKEITPPQPQQPLAISPSLLSPTPTPLSSPPQSDQAVENWQEFRSEKYGFLFRHPDWIEVKENPGTNDSSDFLPFIANWFLLDQQRTKLLVAIFLTNLTIEEIQQRFPDISLTPYFNGNLPGGYARPFVGQNMYILSKSDNQNFLINGHFTDFKETLGEDATAKLIEEIVGSIKLI